jgi:hypothetical protein
MSGQVLPRAGQTYAIATRPFDGWVKIGRTGVGRHPRERLADCQTGNARPLQLRGVWPLDVESALHEMYREFRGSGEWFALPWQWCSDMARFSRRPKPWEDLFAHWIPSTVWAAAGRHAGRKPGPDTLARIFMSRAAADRTGEEKLRTDERTFRWAPEEHDRRLLARGQDLEIVVAGELISCSALSTVTALDAFAGRRRAVALEAE